MLRKALAAQSVMIAGGAAVLCAYGRGGDTITPRRHGTELTAKHCLEATASVISAARVGFCCIGSIDGGPPTCRVMDLQPSTDGSLRCWLITREWTRKAEALRRTPACSLAFHDPRAAGENGYAVLYGSCRELHAAEDRQRCWKPSWSYFHPGGPFGPSVVWEFQPDRVEVISHAHQVAPAWQPATLVRQPDAEWVLAPLVQQERTKKAASGVV